MISLEICGMYVIDLFSSIDLWIYCIFFNSEFNNDVFFELIWKMKESIYKRYLIVDEW